MSENEQIIIDLNQLTRREFREMLARLKDTAGLESDEITGEMVAKVVVSWPYEQEISAAGYMALGLLDSKAVDDALNQAFADIGQKK